MKKLKKKGAFDAINAGMISFLTFMLVAILVILLINVTKQTSMVCKGIWDSDGSCKVCPSEYTYNASSDGCCNSTPVMNCTSGHTTGSREYDGSAYNATKDLMNAGLLPPQFAQIIVIVVIIVGILGLLTALGYGVYRRMER